MLENDEMIWHHRESGSFYVKSFRFSLEKYLPMNFSTLIFGRQVAPKACFFKFRQQLR